LSSTAVTVTVCGTFQLAGVNMSVVWSTDTCTLLCAITPRVVRVVLGLTVTVTLLVGCAVSTTSYVSVR
jgi:hypothetical protein